MPVNEETKLENYWQMNTGIYIFFINCCTFSSGFSFLTFAEGMVLLSMVEYRLISWSILLISSSQYPMIEWVLSSKSSNLQKGKKIILVYPHEIHCISVRLSIFQPLLILEVVVQWYINVDVQMFQIKCLITRRKDNELTGMIKRLFLFSFSALQMINK